ncbi:uncharacterized protein LOC128588629 [Nycticebus coucang]|uniref:uncharacterized protein LOC128588629 n=1 Tax=Nycticebus coucang TaxID=9470 RepID=UPI00234C1C85|nr:uncharacterized protein LOC128588629 [Nycticebus coucang]
MKTLSGSLFLFFWLQLDCTSRGEEVKQSPFLSVREGHSSVINCTYTGSTSIYFYWYKQGPGGLQLLMTVFSSVEKKQEGRLSAWLNKTEKHLFLNISDTQPGDSAVYFCATSTHCFSGVASQKIEQDSQGLSIHEGKTVALTCNYTSYSPTSFQWYRQDPGRGLVFLLLIRENEHEKHKGRWKVTFDTTLKQSSFYIRASQPADSATYLCAADTQQCPGSHFLHPNPA